MRYETPMFAIFYVQMQKRRNVKCAGGVSADLIFGYLAQP